MRHSIQLAALAITLIPAATVTLRAQDAPKDTTCKGKVIFDKAYSKVPDPELPDIKNYVAKAPDTKAPDSKASGTKGPFNYWVQVRNISPRPIHVDLSFVDFKAPVTVTSPTKASVQMNANENLQVLIGTAPDTSFNAATVKFQYDVKGLGPAVVATNCITGKLPDTAQ